MSRVFFLSEKGIIKMSSVAVVISTLRLKVMSLYMGKGVFRVNVDSEGPDKSIHLSCLIRASTIHQQNYWKTM